MDEQRYLRIIWKWSWLLVIAMLVAGLAAYMFTQLKPPVYSASAKIIIGPGLDNPNPDSNIFRASGQLLQTYAELPKTIPFLQGVIEELRLPITPDQLTEKITLEANTETQILTVEVKDRSGEMAVAIANAIANRLVNLSPSGSKNDQTLLNQQIRLQIGNLERSIANTESSIEGLSNELQAFRENQRYSGNDWGGTADRDQQFEELVTRFHEAPDAQSRRAVSEQVLNHLVSTSNARVNALENRLQTTSNLAMQRLILDQITQERDHLSSVQSAIAEVKRLVEDKPLEIYIAELREKIAGMESELQQTVNIDSKRLLDSQIAQERDRLAAAEGIETTRQQVVLEKVAQERDRNSALQGLLVEMESQLMAQIDVERGRLVNQQVTLSTLYQPLQGSLANQVRVIEPAQHYSLLPSQEGLYMLLASLAALILGLVIVFGYEFWSDKVETPEDLTSIVGGQYFGKVSDSPAILGGNRRSIAVQHRPHSFTAESYRMVGSKILFTLNSKSIRSVLIGSPDSSANAAIVAANLAAVLSMAGKKVYLLDANIDKPIVAQLFGMPKEIDNRFQEPGGEQKPILIPVTSLPGLSIYSNRLHSDNTFKMLASPHMSSLIDRFEDISDIILVVSPSLGKSESLVLAGQMDAVILVASAYQISRRKLREISRSLSDLGANVIGSVFKVPEPLSVGMVDWINGLSKRDHKKVQQTELELEELLITKGKTTTEIN